MSNTLVHTPLDEISKIREHLRSTFRSGRARPVEFRKEQLLQLAYLFQDNVQLFQESLRKDLGRPKQEANMADIASIIADALSAYKGIDSWVKPEKAAFDANMFVLSPKVYKEPKGTVLIITPFNYPLWCLGPIVGAIAAGCAAVVKPSELTPATSQLLAELFPKYMDNDLYRVVNGAIEETSKLLSLQWDHILFTGSGRVGRVVAAAAAKHVTPITLELGGKSPVIIHTSADLDLTARRLLWGKNTNAGQTCTAPDYVLVPRHLQDKLVEAFKVNWNKFYGTDAHASDSFSRICAPSHWERINRLLTETKGEVVLGGETIRAEKYIAPTIVKNVTFDDSLMQEEIFGPVLPIVPVADVEAAVEFINSRDHPLALYVFSNDKKFSSHVRENTLSGTFFVNDTIIQGSSNVTPFGGVGESGYGYHKGRHSFDTFVHHRSTFSSPSWLDWVMGFRFPPYTEKSLKKANSMMPTIPYPRPGEKAPISWTRWGALALTLALIAANKERVVSLIKV